MAFGHFPNVSSKSFQCTVIISSFIGPPNMDTNIITLYVFLILTPTLEIFASTWWFLSQFNMSQDTDPRIFCDLIAKGEKRQRKLCEKHPHLIQSMAEGVRAAIGECQFQFRSNKWNCTTYERDATVFGKYLVRGGTRELSFVNAMTTAASVLSMTRDCASGRLSCGCSLQLGGLPVPQAQKQAPRAFKWKGCVESVLYSLNFVRRFVDASESRIRDAKAKTTLHNNRAGRRAFEKEAPVLCKCHGLSGSCTIETCWRTPPSIRALGDALKEKYDGAIRIRIDPAGRLIPVDKLQKKPGKLNLVYYEDSPNFCYQNRSRGVLGTGNRLCNASSNQEDSCDILCCGRGWESRNHSVSYRCECHFIWCCEVICQVCRGFRVESRCKPYLSASPDTRSHTKLSSYSKRPLQNP